MIKGRCGGRPSVQFFNRGLPHSGRSASESSVTTNFITGSSSEGEALSPPFQFSTKAEERDKERIRTEMVLYMKNTQGQFRKDSVQSCPNTIGMNEKLGVDDDEF